MATDIKLRDYEVSVEAFRLKLEGPDLLLDSAERRGGAGGPLRRALVHGTGDRLLVNFNKDYSGGTHIVGTLTVAEGNLAVVGTDITLEHSTRRKSSGGYRRALVHDFNDGLTVNWAGDYPGGVTINGKVNCPGTLVVGSYDIKQVVADLLKRIATLEAKVAALESK